ncbi:GntR family transcriptional regulator [[Kitasatospora] papulosa]|uniref:GntR family transcriptional regulator n=1 Tax=[Kitasatospora] papulosa TaxID=1464011 RepID=UPI00363DCD49
MESTTAPPATADRPQPPKAGTLPRRVYDELRTLLDDTVTYPPGHRMPTYPQMARQYGVAVDTVRLAVRALHLEGRLDPRSSGTYVMGEGYMPPPTGRIPAITAAVRKRILDGAYEPGRSVTQEVAQEFRASIRSVYKALAPLKAEGLMVAERGVGTMVAQRVTGTQR